LGIDSVLQELPLHEACLSLQALGAEAAALFEREPELPGVMLTAPDKVVGLLSRQRFLEYLLHPHGCELFLSEPLSVIYSYARLKPLCLPANTPILVAAQAALRRPIELQGEPILVQRQQGDRLLNAHDLNLAHWHIRGIETQVRHERTQAYMLQNQKMAALGRLVDGVSHEILDPLSFIWGNLAHLSRYCQQLLELVAAYEEVAEPAIAHPTIQNLSESIELDYLREDLPHTIRSIQSGAERLKQLASSLQNFCHIDEVYPKPADLHELIDGIVLLLKSRLTTRIQVNRHYAALPPVICFAGQLSQVFMNILTNCIDALLAKAARHHLSADLGLPGPQTQLFDTSAAPTITITTQLCSAPSGSDGMSDRWVAITISDNGPGLSADAQQQVLNSFSIEQRLAKETDLATSYRIITAKHGGKFYVRSRTFSDNETAPGVGTEFEIRLPLQTGPNSP
jgi:hypothetical protein